MDEATPQVLDDLQWVDRPAIETPMGLQAVTKSAEGPQEFHERRKILRPFPTYTWIPLVAYSNAPSRPEGDGDKRNMEQNLRDILRLLATLDGCMRAWPWQSTMSYPMQSRYCPQPLG